MKTLFTILSLSVMYAIIFTAVYDVTLKHPSFVNSFLSLSRCSMVYPTCQLKNTTGDAYISVKPEEHCRVTVSIPTKWSKKDTDAVVVPDGITLDKIQYVVDSCAVYQEAGVPTTTWYISDKHDKFYPKPEVITGGHWEK